MNKIQLCYIEKNGEIELLQKPNLYYLANNISNIDIQFDLSVLSTDLRIYNYSMYNKLPPLIKWIHLNMFLDIKQLNNLPIYIAEIRCSCITNLTYIMYNNINIYYENLIHRIKIYKYLYKIDTYFIHSDGLGKLFYKNGIIYNNYIPK